MKNNESAESDFENGFNKVSHDIPYERELLSMSDSNLAIELSSSQKDSSKYIVIEREIARRANVENLREAYKQKKWYEKPLGIIAIGVLVFSLGWAIKGIFGL